ncbi:copper resistance protein CopC [Actinoplanes sp. LDG1-06]|uniref:Copper resistance protein CopC n=1 Tax=Paractinoplanes ovalisporus TaxID=2810368 RepID=A0ABS2AGT2_9ACTN|nr:copper resistance CopC family protein [Actinoplanes ovalisporus]MBM2619030.1 copper resistance protein CopC [Actinoplanes ovalisporus]
MTKPVTRLLVALAAVLAVLLPGAPALAHNALAEATPAKGSTVKKAPTSVKLKFLQKLNPEYTTIAVSSGSTKIDASDPEVAGATGTITFEPLANGAYTVAYRVVSQDGHTVQGSYKFTVADPAATAAPSSEPAPAPDESLVEVPPTATSAAPSAPAADLASAESDDSGNTTMFVVIGAIVVALLAFAGFLFARNRRAG